MALLGKGVALADKITKKLGLQGTVTYYAFQSADGAGVLTYAAPVSRGAIVTRKQKLVKAPDGTMQMSTAQLAFLTPGVVNLLDKIVLPDGSTGPILNTDGFLDGGNLPILTEIYLG